MGNGGITMISHDEIKRDIVDMIMEYIAENDEVNFCGDCPLYVEDRDVGYYDCEYGGAIDSCVYSPIEDLETLASKITDVIISARP